MKHGIKPGQFRKLADNYRPFLAAILALLICTTSFAQYDSTRVRQAINAYGYEWKNAKFNGSIILPIDTPQMAIADTGAIAIKANKLFTWGLYDGTYKWGEKSGTTASISGDTLFIGSDTIILRQTFTTNGLSKSGDTILLGGTLNRNTTVDLDAYNYSYKTSSGDSITYGSEGYGGSPSVKSSNWLTMLLKGKYLIMPMFPDVPDAADAFPRIQIGVNRSSGGYSRNARYSAAIEGFAYSGDNASPAVDSNRNKPLILVTTGFNNANGGAGDIILRPGVTNTDYSSRYGNFHVKLEPSGTGTVKTPYKAGDVTDSVMMWRASDSSFRMIDAALIGTGGTPAATDTIYFENGPYSSQLDTLLTKPNDSTVQVKSLGTDLPRTRVQVGPDSLKLLIAAYIDSVITANAVTLLFDSLGTGQASLLSRNDTLITRLFRDTGYVKWDTATNGSLRAAIDTATLFPAIRATVSGGGGGGWALTGNSISGDSTLGTTSNNGMRIITNNTARAIYTRDGYYFWNATTPVSTYKWNINDTARILSVKIGNAPTVATFKNAALSIGTASTSSLDYAIYVEDNAGGSLFRLSNAGEPLFPKVFSNLSATGITFLGDNTKLFNANAISGSRTPVWRFNSSALNAASNQYFFQQDITYSGTGGTGGSIFAVHRIAPTINQGGTGLMKTTGLFIDPILTNAADYRNITTVTTATHLGRIRIDESVTVTTTDATQTTGASIVVDTAGHIVEVDWTIKGEDGSGNIAIYKRLVRVKNVAGTLTILGTPDAIGTDYEDAGISSASITFDVSGTSLRCMVTGIAATTINWRTVHQRRHL